MKKIMTYFVLIITLFISCEEPDTNTPVTAIELSKNSIFISIVQENQASINRFGAYINSLNLKSNDMIGQFTNQVKTETDYKKLITYLGYNNEAEFESVYLAVSSKYKLLLKSYPELGDENKLKVLFKEAMNLYLLENKSMINTQNDLSYDRKGAKTMVEYAGCAGGVACIKFATLCNIQAETEFAITAAGCNSFRLNLVAWAFCQAGANVMYSADIIVCTMDLDSCCNLQE